MGWNLASGSNRSDTHTQPVTESTDRLLLLKDVFRKNEAVFKDVFSPE